MANDKLPAALVAENVGTLVALARAVDSENTRLDKLLKLSIRGGFAGKDKADLGDMISESFQLCTQRSSEIRDFAKVAPQSAAAKLYDAALRLDNGDHENGVPAMLNEAAAVWERDASDSPDDLLFIYSDPKSARIGWKRFEYPVSHAWAEAFRMMLAAKGQPVGIGGGKPLRKPADDLQALKAEFPELAAIVARGKGNSGYRLTIFD